MGTDQPEERRPFKRALLKLSGEALMGDRGMGIDPAVVARIADEVVAAARSGVEIALVVGGGNFFRGARAAEVGMDRVAADNVGMLATVMNALMIQDAAEKRGYHTRVISAIQMNAVAEPFIRRRAIRHLEKKRLIIFAAGMGQPYFTTDSAAVHRALEIKAEIMMKATGVDGVYTADPKRDPTATRLVQLTHREVIERNLRVMDTTAISLAMDQALPLVVFDMNVPGNITRALSGERLGSMITTIRSGDQHP